jgi:transcriptional regulator with XRE-family HTH domain
MRSIIKEYFMGPELQLGNILRTAREQLGLSMQDVGDQVGVNRTSILRFETNARRPSPETLQRLAPVLALSTSDLFAIGDYAVPGELPTLQPYLRAKYGLDDPKAYDEIREILERVARRYGDLGIGPANGEDETDTSY